MKTISHIIKEKEKHCVICNKKHTIPTIVINETTIYQEKPITYPSIYDYCSIAQELMIVDGYQQSNKNEKEKALYY